MKKSLFTIICILITVLITLWFLNIIKPDTALNLSNGREKIDLADINPEQPLAFTENSKVIKSGYSIYDILNNENVPSRLISSAVNSLKEMKQKIILKPGLKYEYFKNDKDEPSALIIQLSEEKRLIIDMTKAEAHCFINRIPLNVQCSILSANIKDSLFETLSTYGFNDSLAYELNSIFMWDIDFNTDIRSGDRFIVIFEKYSEQSGKTSSKKILGAQMIIGGKKHIAIGFYNDKGNFEYFNESGRHLKKQFLNSPIKFARISSRFSYRRFHPILKIFRPHLGIDYSASNGTPVVATANGKVIYKGWDKGGGGNALKIRHPNGFITVYMHLQKFAKNLILNKTINQGEIIGYVGKTGLATGPHLDYRMQQNGRYINPLRFRNPDSGELDPSLMKYFKQYRDQVLSELEKHSGSDYYGDLEE